MILGQCANISQGAFLSRIQTLPSKESTTIPMYSMKDMNDRVHTDSDVATLQEVCVLKQKMKQLPIAKEGMVVINLTAHRASVIDNEHEGKLIPSNFAIVEPNETLDPYYFAWYVNEHPHCHRQLLIFTQGSSVSALSIQMLRTLEVTLPSISEQRRFGRINQLLLHKHQLMSERMHLEETLTKHTLLQHLNLKGDL